MQSSINIPSILTWKWKIPNFLHCFKFLSIILCQYKVNKLNCWAIVLWNWDFLFIYHFILSSILPKVLCSNLAFISHFQEESTLFNVLAIGDKIEIESEKKEPIDEDFGSVWIFECNCAAIETEIELISEFCTSLFVSAPMVKLCFISYPNFQFEFKFVVGFFENGILVEKRKVISPEDLNLKSR